MSSINIFEYLIYLFVFGSIIFLLCYRDPYLCLYFFIVWLPFQNFILSKLIILDIFSKGFIIFLTSLKELALFILLLSLLFKKQLFREKLSTTDLFFWLNILFLIFYFFLPDKYLGYSANLQDKVFGLRFSIVSLMIFFVGRNVVFNEKKIMNAIRLLISISILLSLFGFIEVLLIPRSSLINGLTSIIELKGGINPLYFREDLLSYVMNYGGIEVKRMMSLFLSPLGLAYFLILPFSIILVYITEKTENPKLTILKRSKFLLIILGSSILFTITRGVIIALAFITILFLVKKSIKLFLLVIVFFMAIFLTTPLSHIFIATKSLEEPSSIAHVYAYEIGFQKIMEHPLGIGLGKAGPVAFQMGSEGLYGDDATIGESLYLTIFIERGLIGFLLFFGFIASILRDSKKLSFSLKKSLESNISTIVYLSTIAFIIGSIPTEVWLGFRYSGIYWWFAGLVVQLTKRNNL